MMVRDRGEGASLLTHPELIAVIMGEEWREESMQVYLA
jgi:hypothetical protein